MTSRTFIPRREKCGQIRKSFYDIVYQTPQESRELKNMIGMTTKMSFKECKEMLIKQGK